jgi:sensor histidine kinase regulating citrate/malate metabolism
MMTDDRSRLVLHQISTPLTSVMLGLEEIQAQPEKSTHEIKWLISEMKKVAATLQDRTSEDLLRENFSPAQIIQELLSAYRKPYHLKCHFVAPKTCPEFFGRSDAFAEIVTHLLNNAAEAYQQNKSDREVSLELIPGRSGLNLIVADNGRGICWWQKLLLALPGVSFKKQPSGLGFYRAAKLVKQEFDGQIQVMTTPGRGTIVIVYFPLS